MKAPVTNSKPRVLCPRGQHLCRLVQIVDLGSQHFKPGDDASRKLYFGFETCHKKHVFDETKGEEPFMLQIEFAFYMTSASATKQTKLRQFVVQWFDKDFDSDDAARNFEFGDLVGRLAMITVAHKPKLDGSMKAVIADIYLPSKEEREGAPEAYNPTIVYEIENGEDCPEFKLLPPFIQKKIKESEEFKGPQKTRTEELEEEIDADSDDSVPF